MVSQTFSGTALPCRKGLPRLQPIVSHRLLRSHRLSRFCRCQAEKSVASLHILDETHRSLRYKAEGDVPQHVIDELQPEISAIPVSADIPNDSQIEALAPWQRYGRNLARGAIVFGMAVALALAPMSGSALAARSSGRVGGNSFAAARSSGSFGEGSSRSYGGGSSFGGSSSRGSSSSSSFGGSSSRGSSSRGGSSFFGGSGGGSSSFMSSLAGGRSSYSSSSPSYSAPSMAYRAQPSYVTSFGESTFTGGMAAPVAQSSGFGGGGLIAILALGLLAFVLFQAFGDNLDEEPGSGNGTVVKLSVALNGSARSLQHELERMAKRADTNSSEGLHYVLQETVLALLRHPEYCEYATSSKKNVSSLDDAEESFNEASMEERGKYKEETLSNVGGRTKNSTGNGKWASGKDSKGPGDDLIVVTILAATDGAVNVQKVNNNETLRAALNKLGGIRSDQVMAVEVIWTPGDDSDSYSRDEMMMEFPQMSTL